MRTFQDLLSWQLPNAPYNGAKYSHHGAPPRPLSESWPRLPQRGVLQRMMWFGQNDFCSAFSSSVCGAPLWVLPKWSDTPLGGKVHSVRTKPNIRRGWPHGPIMPRSYFWAPGSSFLFWQRSSAAESCVTETLLCSSSCFLLEPRKPRQGAMAPPGQ